MEPQSAVEMGREAVLHCLTMLAPIMIVGLLASIVIGVIQSMTQLQDQTISFIPKVVLIILTLALCLPWLTDRMIEFSQQSFESPKMSPRSQWSWPVKNRPNVDARSKGLGEERRDVLPDNPIN